MAAELVDDAGEGIVVHDLTFGDHDDALAERGDVLHVVAGEQDGDLAQLL